MIGCVFESLAWSGETQLTPLLRLSSPEHAERDIDGGYYWMRKRVEMELVGENCMREDADRLIGRASWSRWSRGDRASKPAM